MIDQVSIEKATRKVLVDGTLMKVHKLPFVGKTTATETKTGWKLPPKAAVYDVFVNVTDAQEEGTLKIGTDSTDSGDADGFANGISCASLGVARPGVTITDGVYASNTRGALLSSFTAGSAADDRGLYQEKPCFTQGGKEITYTPSALSTSMEGDIYIVYAEL